MQNRWVVITFLALALAGSGAVACGEGEFLANNSLLGSSNVALMEIKNCSPLSKPVRHEEPFLAEAKDLNGNVISSPVVFRSSRPDIAEVVNHVLKTYYPGQTLITASSGGVTSAPCGVTVLPLALGDCAPGDGDGDRKRTGEGRG